MTERIPDVRALMPALPETSEAFQSLAFLERQGIVVSEGIDDQVINAIIHHTRQRHILHSTPKDLTERFTDRPTFDRWYDETEHRHMYPIHHGSRLAGIIWFRDEAYPPAPDDPASPRDCFAIRMYEHYVGTGLARHVMAAAHARYELIRHRENGIWLDTSLENVAARATYPKFGYRPQPETGNGRLYMLLSAERLRRLVAANQGD